MKLDNLNEEEVKLIMEALIFGCSADITVKWTEKDRLKLLDIAVKIKRKVLADKEVLLDGNLEISKEDRSDNPALVNLIRTYFDLNNF